MRLEDLRNYKDEIQNIIGYRFKNNSLFEQAFTRKSYAIENGCESNEILEFIGDRVIEFYITNKLIEKYSYLNSKNEFCFKNHLDEAKLSEIKENFVSNKRLAAIINDLGIVPFMLMGECDFKNSVILETKPRADLLESIIGAVYIDCGYDNNLIYELLNKLLLSDKYLDDIKFTNHLMKCDFENPITELKEMFEQGYVSKPNYIFSEEMVDVGDGVMKWEVECIIESHDISVGSYADTKKEAKKNAAYLALCEFYDIDPDIFNGKSYLIQ